MPLTVQTGSCRAAFSTGAIDPFTARSVEFDACVVTATPSAPPAFPPASHFMPTDHARTMSSAPARPSRLSRLLRIDETPVGKGVFARRRIASGVVLGEVTGQILDDHPEDSSYVMELPGGRLLDPASPFRFMNHSCEPNCELFYWEVEPGEVEEERLWVQTIRPIETGEQLLIDYSWPADAAIPCRCGSEACRGWIVDPAERHLVDEQPEA